MSDTQYRDYSNPQSTPQIGGNPMLPQGSDEVIDGEIL
jgi:hypothetical protein